MPNLKICLLFAVGLLVSCGPPKATPVENVVQSIHLYYDKTITIKTKLRSGARCRLDDEEWKAYCKDCQYCRGPYVVSGVKGDLVVNEEDWPMILGGSWDYQEIRCKGPLNEVACHPFDLGKTYVIRGFLEKSQPPKLFVDKFWAVN